MIRNIFNLFVIKGSVYLFPIIVMPILTRRLTLDSFGVLSLMLAIQQYLLMIVEYGFTLIGSRDISSSSSVLHNKIFAGIVFSRIFIAIILLFPLIILTSLFYPQSINEILIVSITVFVSSLNPLFYYLGKERTSLITIVSMLSRLISIIFIYFLVNKNDDISLSLIGYSINYIFPIVILYIFDCYQMLNYSTICRVNFNYIKINLKSGFDLFLSNIFTSTYGPITVMVLGLMTNTETVAVFSAADKLRAAFQGLLQPVSQALYPRLAKLKDTPVEFWKKWGQFRNILFILSFFLFIFLLFFGKILLIKFLGAEFVNSYLYLVSFSFCILFVSLGISYGQNLFVIIGKTKIIRNVYFFASLSHIILMPIIIFVLGGVGAAISITLTEFFVVILLLFRKARLKNE